MFVVVFGAFVAARKAHFNARLADALGEIGIVREIFDDKCADVGAVSRELNAVNQSLDFLAHEAGGCTPFAFKFAFGACIDTFFYNQIAKHRRY